MMTREEAIEWVEENFTFLAISDAHLLIDKIHDDFESRTCENCKYYIPKDDCNSCRHPDEMLTSYYESV